MQSYQEYIDEANKLIDNRQYIEENYSQEKQFKDIENLVSSII